MTAADVALGSLTSATNAVQTISFGGTPTGGFFTLAFNGTTSNPITYSTNPTTLQTSIQTEMDNIAGAGNTVVSATSATSVNVAFQGTFAGISEPTMTTPTVSLSGNGATVSVATTTAGFGPWGPAINVGTGVNLGQIGIALSSSTPNTNLAGGSIVLITFHILPTAPGGPTQINLEGTAVFTTVSGGVTSMVTVSTRLDSPAAQIPLRPTPTNSPNDVGVDGTVTIAAPHFVFVTPAGASPGTPFNFTLTAATATGATNTGYTGTVHFSSSDTASSVALPADYTFTAADAGVHIFSATLSTVGSQTITATDTSTSVLKNTSSPINVVASGTHFTVAAPTSVTINNVFQYTVTALDSTNTVIPGYSGTIHFSSTDPSAALPADATLTSGVGTFSATFKTAGPQTLTATDTSSSRHHRQCRGHRQFRPAHALRRDPGHQHGHGRQRQHDHRDRAGRGQFRFHDLHRDSPLQLDGHCHGRGLAVGLHVYHGRSGRARLLRRRQAGHVRHADRDGLRQRHRDHYGQ